MNGRFSCLRLKQNIVAVAESYLQRRFLFWEKGGGVLYTNRTLSEALSKHVDVVDCICFSAFRHMGIR